MAELTEAEFASLYERTARPLWMFAYRITGNGADADDIVQEAFARVLTAVLPDTDDAVRAYLFRVAANLATDRWRRAAREQASLRLVQPDAITTPAARDNDVARTFFTLKPRDRALLWLAYVEGQTHEEIADTLAVKRGSVKVLLSRARARLRTLLRSDRFGLKGDHVRR